MNSRWLLALAGCLGFPVFLIFIPVDCGSPVLGFPNSHCLVWSSPGHYESIAYAYGGLGAIYQAWSSQYTISAWASPLAPFFWTLVGLLVSVDLLSIIVITHRLAKKRVVSRNL